MAIAQAWATWVEAVEDERAYRESLQAAVAHWSNRELALVRAGVASSTFVQSAGLLQLSVMQPVRLRLGNFQSFSLT